MCAWHQVLYADVEDWPALLKTMARSGQINEVAFMEALQRRMEGCVLGLQSGSYAQRVQAEYLKEVNKRCLELCDTFTQVGAHVGCGAFASHAVQMLE